MVLANLQFMFADSAKNQMILNQQIESSLMVNTRAKMLFLQDEKERLQTLVSQLQQNNDLLRTINKQLTSQIDLPSLSITLNQQNTMLQMQYVRILRENQHLSSEILLRQQIMDETDLESQAILKEYQVKIIELRRAIQIKQVNIQDLERRLNSDCHGNVVVPPNNVTLLFYNEVDQLKRNIERLTINNKQLSNENRKLQNHKEELQKKLQLMEALTLRSKLMFGEFKQLYTEQKRSHSVPRKDTDFPFTGCLHSSKCRLNDGQTRESRESSECQPSRYDGSAKMLLYREVLEVQKLSRTCEQLKHQVEAERQSKARLVASYVQQAKRTGELSKELNYYQQSTRDLLMMLSHRRQAVGRSQEKSRGDRLLRSLKLPARTPVNSERKKYWLSVQASVKPDKRKLLQIKKKYKKTLRSLSCTTDYRTWQFDNQSKMKSQHLFKKERTVSNRMKSQQVMYRLTDLTLDMQSQIGVDISIIGSSAQVKTSYANWKSAQKNSVISNLTILEQNIL